MDESKRKDPTLRQVLAAAVIQLLEIPHEHAKLMSVDQILSLVHRDHDPIPWSTARDLGMSPDQYNHPSNLTLRPVPDHQRKTRTFDLPQIAKSKRIAKATAEHEANRRRLLAPAHGPDVAETDTRPTRKLRSRGFRKPPPGLKRTLPSRPMRKESQCR